MSNPSNPNPLKASVLKENSWIFALIVSVALNGLLAGILIAKQNAPARSPETFAQSMPKHGPRGQGFDSPKALIGHLPHERRKTVLKSASKHIRANMNEHPRRLFAALRRSRKQTIAIINAETLDTQALKASLETTRQIKDKLASHSNALILEITQQLTLDERRASLPALRKAKQKKLRKLKEKHKLKNKE